MPKSCSVCNSVNRNEWEADVRAGSPLNQVYRKANLTEHIPKSSFYSHMKYHLEGIILKDVSKDKVLAEEVSSSIKTIRTLNKNMILLSNRVDEIINSDSTNFKDALPLMSELRMIVAELRLFMQTFKVNVSSNEDIFDRILYALRDLSLDQIQAVRNRWQEFESNGNKTIEKDLESI
jgi:hypothetical protein